MRDSTAIKRERWHRRVDVLFGQIEEHLLRWKQTKASATADPDLTCDEIDSRRLQAAETALTAISGIVWGITA